MTVRPATGADAPDIARIEALAGDTRWPGDAVRATLAAPSTRAFVAGAPVVGHLVARCAADEGEVLTVAVLPEARRHGAGRALLAAAESAFRAEGIARAWLEVRADNAPAIALYRSRGWSDAGRRRAYYADGADAVVMTWSS